jgi:hypothetical protein|tara:strand:- start:596 stop:856 length:261 start_codon:yes stop_codon:yes gene_type:complete
MAEKKSQKLDKEELEILQKLNKDFQLIKNQLGDIEISKNNVIKNLNVIQNMFKEQEKKLLEKYGDNVVINLETGVINPKEEEESKE